jgi:hypothetical protein
MILQQFVAWIDVSFMICVSYWINCFGEHTDVAMVKFSQGVMLPGTKFVVGLLIGRNVRSSCSMHLVMHDRPFFISNFGLGNNSIY